MVRLILTAAAHRALVPLVSRGRRGMEEVAFLHGSIRPGCVKVTAVRPVRNTHRCPGGFGVSAGDYRGAVASGSLVGLFHTHVRDCTPSEADLRLLRRHSLVQIIGAPGAGRAAPRLRGLSVLDDGRIGFPAIEVSST